METFKQMATRSAICGSCGHDLTVHPTECRGHPSGQASTGEVHCTNPSCGWASKPYPLGPKVSD